MHLKVPRRTFAFQRTPSCRVCSVDVRVQSVHAVGCVFVLTPIPLVLCVRLVVATVYALAYIPNKCSVRTLVVCLVMVQQNEQKRTMQ